MTEPNDPIESNAESDQPITSAQEAELIEALYAAYRPAPLDPAVHEALLALALEDPLRPASEQEQRESERFRRALEGREQHPDLELVHGLLEAHGPGRAETSISALNDRVVDRALQGRTRGQPGSKPGKGNLVFVAFGVVTAFCAAAALLLVLAFPSSKESAVTAASPAAMHRPEQLTQSRSTEALFDAKFERDRTTARVDRIASVRERELRANRFQAWGVLAP